VSTEAGTAPARGGLGWRLWALVPVLLLAVMVGAVSTSGSWLADLIGRNPPPTDKFDIRRVEFGPGEIRILVRNPQSADLTIASVNVDDAIVRFTADGPTTLGRLRSSTIVVPYAWVEDDPITVGVTSSTGIETAKEVPAAVATPEASVSSFLGYALIGVLVGVIPIALGLLWLPALRQASPVWLGAFMAFTAGLLSFLGVEALAEAFEFQSLLPAALGGAGLVLLGVALSFLGMTALSAVSWFCECLAAYVCVRGLDLDLSLADTVVVFSVGSLAGALSFLPGGLGVAEASMTGLIRALGDTTRVAAAAATVLIRLATLWFAVALGLIGLAVEERLARGRTSDLAEITNAAGTRGE